MLLALLGCAGCCFDGNFIVADANNYNFTSVLDISSIEVDDAADILVDWSALTTDMLGHEMDPAVDAGTIWLVSFPYLDQEEAAQKFVIDDVEQGDLGGFATFDNTTLQGTDASFSEFMVLTNPFVPEEYFTDLTATWLLRVTSGSFDEGGENRMLQFIVPSETSDNRLVEIGNDSTTLELTVDLGSLEAWEFDEAEGEAMSACGSGDCYTMDWNALTTHANGTAIELDYLDELMIARYDGKTVEDLEGSFIDIESLADAIYTQDVFGLREASLCDAEDADGNAFSGFGQDALWLLALRCTTCLNPAPPFLTVVQVGNP